MNCRKPTLVVYIKGSTTEEVDEFDYLYDILNNKANNDSLLKQMIANVYDKIIGLCTFCKEVCMGQYELNLLPKLYGRIFVSSLLFNCQSWTNLRTSSDIKSLHQIQMKLKQIMQVSYSTPNVGVYLELGILPTENKINKT